MVSKIMKKMFKTAFLAALSLFLLTGIYTNSNAMSKVIVKKQNLYLSNWHNEHNNLKIVLISDLHVGSPFTGIDKVNKIVELANNETPDLVFLLGDFINEFTFGGKYIEPYVISNALGNLKAKYGVFAVLGNHDRGDGIYKLKKNHKIFSFLTKHNGISDARELENTLQLNNISVLENKLAQLTINNQSFWIAGISDFKTGNPDINILNDINDNNPILLITHNADIFPSVPEKVSLSLAGHTHGGQFNLPFTGGIYFSPRTGKTYKTGYMIKDKHNIFITSGIGTSTIPVRWHKPEIVILEINAKNNSN